MSVERSTLFVSNYILLVQLGGSSSKWQTLSHNGVLFPPEYVKHNIPVIYKGNRIILNKDAEEIATLYARMLGSDHLRNKIFNKNFWNDWKKTLKDTPIDSLDSVDFSLISEYVQKQKEERKSDVESKEKAKMEEEKFKFAIVDGKTQPIGNFRVEPPGIFMGRGCNPNLGRVKRRVYPEDVIINIGKESKIPETISGHEWGKVIHDKTVEWLASWKDTITRKIKYVWLGAHSDMKARGDMAKFDLARQLKKKIKTVREENTKALSSDSGKTRQIATALYFIDNFALRVGNEKGEDEADTVGVTSLRKEHITLSDGNKVKLDFLGKDSVRFNRTLVVNDIVYDNLNSFLKDENKEQELFDLISSNDINKYLQSIMPKLTAKVFRTFNASNLFYKELKKISAQFDKYEESDKVNLLLNEFNKANAKVALLCNHQKNINKSTEIQITKIDGMIKQAKDKLKTIEKGKKNELRIKKIKDLIKKLKAKKQLKIDLKNISLGTSKINYIDPRISIAFMKLHKIPIDKIFSKKLQEKFKWAIEIDEKYKF